jgi:hypothetical protein
MTSRVTFAQARSLVVQALSPHYFEKFPERQLAAQVEGRDLVDSWAVFLGLRSGDGSFEALIGAPVAVVSKADGALTLAQIPPRFEILDAPLIVDAVDEVTPPDQV